MLRISSPNNCSAKCTPNLLPCRINHDGPVDAAPRYWAREAGAGGQPEAYFRGRKLKGREIKVPEGYKGVIVKEAPEEKDTTKQRQIDVGRNGEADQQEDETIPKVLQEVGSFDEVVLWGHENLVEGDDAFVKGMGEWIGFAEAMHKPG